MDKNLLIMTGGNDLPNYNNNKANLKRYFDENVYFKYALKQKIKIPMIAKKRSLNLSTSVAIILSESQRQLKL